MLTKHLFREFLILVSIFALFGSVCIKMNALAGTTDDDINANLISAAFSGNLLEVERLLAKGANIDAKRNDGITALMGASVAGHRDIVELLLAKGANIDEVSRVYGSNETACSLAYERGYREIVDLFIRAGSSFREEQFTSPEGK